VIANDRYCRRRKFLFLLRSFLLARARIPDLNSVAHSAVKSAQRVPNHPHRLACRFVTPYRRSRLIDVLRIHSVD
jgi:hypothetical protein